MEPEQSPTPNNNVDGILRDASTPLHYSSAVRALLGMPEAEEEDPAFTRMVPPAGFQYHLHPPTGEASRIPEPLEDTVPSAFDEAQTSELHSSEGRLDEPAPDYRPVEVLRKWLLDTLPPSPPTTVAPRPSTLEQPPGAQPDAADRSPTPAVDPRTSDQRGSTQRGAQPQDAGAPAEPVRRSVAATATAGQSGDMVEHITIARMVPPVGFQYHLHPPTNAASRILHPLAKTVLSALDEAQTSELHSSEGTLREAAPAHRVERNRASVAAAAPARQAGDVPEPTTIAVPGISERSQYFLALAPEEPEDRPASTATEPSPQRVRPRDPQRQTAERLVSPDQAQAFLTEAPREIQARVNPNEATLPLDLHPWRVPSPAMKEGEAGSIEQLQRTVRELAAQVASWQARKAHEGQPRQSGPKPPRPIERVLIIKQAAQHSGPPLAFWERSYLGHLSWRTMR